MQLGVKSNNDQIQTITPDCFMGGIINNSPSKKGETGTDLRLIATNQNGQKPCKVTTTDIICDAYNAVDQVNNGEDDGLVLIKKNDNTLAKILLSEIRNSNNNSGPKLTRISLSTTQNITIDASTPQIIKLDNVIFNDIGLTINNDGSITVNDDGKYRFNYTVTLNSLSMTQTSFTAFLCSNETDAFGHSYIIFSEGGETTINTIVTRELNSAAKIQLLSYRGTNDSYNICSTILLPNSKTVNEATFLEIEFFPE